MAERNGIDRIDQNILRRLSDYGKLTLLELWCEFGEDEAVKERVTER